MDSQASAGTPRAAESQRQRQRHTDTEAAGRAPRRQSGTPGGGTPAAMLLALQRTAGNRAVSRAVAIQRTLTNDAEWDAIEPVTGQGTRVRAITGPGYAYGSKTKTQTGFRPYDYTALFTAATKSRQYCQGHLLNDNLGGPGDPGAAYAAQNLTAFPQWPTNTDHKTTIENPMKGAALGAWFRYEVGIGYSTDSAPRLRKRLNKKVGNDALATAAGIAATAQTFTYASSLTAHWTELVQSPGATNAGVIAGTEPLSVRPAGNAGTLSLSIPSPMTFTSNDAAEYPTYVPPITYGHMTNLKGNQAGNRIGTLPTGGNAAWAGRAHVVPLRWEAVDFARAGNPMPPGVSATYRAGFQHYGQGVTASRDGTPVTRYGYGFTLGYQDFDAGIVHGRSNLLTAPPAPQPAPTLAGHNEFWAGVALGRTTLLAAPPVGNRAHIAGHAEFWAGVRHGRTHDKLPAPVNLAEAAGHNEYWAGIELGYTTTKATKPAGNLATEEGHLAYWEGAEAARADPAAPVVPPTTAKVKGHTDVVDGVKHAQAKPRGTAPAVGSLARTAAWTEYWQGVDFGRANPAATPYGGPSSAEKAGAADYRAGADSASKDFGAFTGAPSAAGGGAREGFEDLTAGAKGQQAGTPADAARSAHVRGWQDSAAGMAAGAVLGAIAARADGGFMSGFLHAHGAALAQGSQPAPLGTAGPGEAAVATGHAAYGTGLATARADLGSTPVPLMELQAHGEFVSGVTHAQASARGAAPAAGSAARTQAWTEYWQGVDFGRANPVGVAYAGPSSAERAGVLDYRAGADQAHGSLASLTGAAPVAGGSAEGFADYKAGVDGCQDGMTADAARSAHARGWQDCAAGMTAGGAVAPPPPVRADGGFMSGFLHAHGAALAQGAQAAPVGGLDQTVAAGGHAGYLAGMATARAALGSPTPQQPADALGHGDFVAGVTHAQASARGAAPAAGSAARTQAWTEYWHGVDWAQANPVATAYGGPSSAEEAGAADYRIGVQHAIAHPSGTALPSAEPAAAEGAADYWQGEAHAVANAAAPGGPAVAATTAHTDYWNGAGHAQGSVANLQGAPPLGRVEALGFAAYQSGAYGAHHSAPNIAANLAYSHGWNAFTDAAAHVRAGAVNVARLDSGYLYGVLHTNPPVAKRPNVDPVTDNKRARHF